MTPTEQLELERERGELEPGGAGDWHYVHPVDPELTWCGARREQPGPPPDPEPRLAGSVVVCVVCCDLRALYGVAGWLALRDGAR